MSSTVTPFSLHISTERGEFRNGVFQGVHSTVGKFWRETISGKDIPGVERVGEDEGSIVFEGGVLVARVSASGSRMSAIAGSTSFGVFRAPRVWAVFG